MHPFSFIQPLLFVSVGDLQTSRSGLSDELEVHDENVNKLFAPHVHLYDSFQTYPQTHNLCQPC